MILSASRRTDIPNYFSDWFYNRLRAGSFYVKNLFNPRQISKITATPDVVDCIVFWTKNPEPMLTRLAELAAYCYYFQFTVTAYGADIEPRVPDKWSCILPLFRRLAEIIGPERVIWRYDPIFFSPSYPPERHVEIFSKMAEELQGYTKQCVISFIDRYRKNTAFWKAAAICELPEEKLRAFAGKLAQIARQNEIELAACAEQIDLSECGIQRSACIDKGLIEKLLGCGLALCKDKNQRPECGCAESIDVGAYHTCPNACRYCYANKSKEMVRQNWEAYDAQSPILCGSLCGEDQVTVRTVRSLKRSV